MWSRSGVNNTPQKQLVPALIGTDLANGGGALLIHGAEHDRVGTTSYPTTTTKSDRMAKTKKKKDSLELMIYGAPALTETQIVFPNI